MPSCYKTGSPPSPQPLDARSDPQGWWFFWPLHRDPSIHPLSRFIDQCFTKPVPILIPFAESAAQNTGSKPRPSQLLLALGIVLSTLAFLLSWQFAQFVLLLQNIALLGNLKKSY